jgi:isoquinoline 1-oxidoreductase subunit beta
MWAMVAFTRRAFLEATGGLVIGFALPWKLHPFAEAEAEAAAATPAAGASINAFLRIGTDDTVTILVNHSEMGQGIWTTLPMLLAEELEADWSKIRVEHAPAAPAYFQPGSTRQGTGGSGSTISEFERMRQVGATAREMLIAAAARRWKTDASQLRAENGFVVRGKDRLSYGRLAADAARLKPPETVKLKDASEWKIVGKPHKRLDSPEKVTGRAQFGADVRFPGLLTAVVLRSPSFGGTLKSFHAEEALRVPGVKKVLQVPSGVAVVADHFWAAQRAREKVQAEWDLGPGGEFDSNVYLGELRELVKKPGDVVVEAGDVAAALAGAAKRIEAQYELPYLAHAPMEPLNATVKIGKGTCEIWTGTQAQTQDQKAAADILGIAPEKVTLHTMFLGGGFGRRAARGADFVTEAVHVAKAAGAPVKTMWTREDDIQGGNYRPMFVHRIEGGLDDKGRPVAWRQTIAGQPIAPPGRKDQSAFAGIPTSPYLKQIAAHRVTQHSPPTPVTVQWWRSVGNSHTAFAVESFVDELAHAAKRDPVELRREMYRDHAQHARVLEAAAERAGWGKPPPAGQARGVAVHASFGSLVAQVAEVSLDGDRIRVHRVVCAVDCGQAVNPAGVVAQMESAILYGLSAAMFGAIHIVKGRVQEGNFDDYRLVRQKDAPHVDVVLVPSQADMGGIGEPGTPPIAPAVANAMFALTGKRLRTLPFLVTA